MPCCWSRRQAVRKQISRMENWNAMQHAVLVIMQWGDERKMGGSPSLGGSWAEGDPDIVWKEEWCDWWPGYVSTHPSGGRSVLLRDKIETGNWVCDYFCSVQRLCMSTEPCGQVYKPEAKGLGGKVDKWDGPKAKQGGVARLHWMVVLRTEKTCLIVKLMRVV